MSVPELRLGILLRSRTLLAVASGREGFPVDAVLYRAPWSDGQRIPVIPGPTFKGVLRKSASKVAWLLGLSSCHSVRPEAEYTCMGRWGRPCDIHLVFGAPGRLRSAVEISQLVPVESEEEARRLFDDAALWLRPYRPGRAPPTFNVTRVGIRDDACVASEGLLYTYEQMPIGVAFYGEVAIAAHEELALKAVKLVLAGLANLRLDRLGRAGIADASVIAVSPKLGEIVNKDLVASSLLRGLKRGWWF